MIEMWQTIGMMAFIIIRPPSPAFMKNVGPKETEGTGGLCLELLFAPQPPRSTPGPWLMRFLGLAKIRMYQIRST